MSRVQRERAVALAGLGDLAPAVALITQQLAEAEVTGNPLELGASHRDRARIALLAKGRNAKVATDARSVNLSM